MSNPNRYPLRSLEEHEPTLARIVAAISSLDGVVALSLGGSTQAGLADDDSDLDIHVYWRPPLAPPDRRAAVLGRFADDGSLRTQIRSWGLEDHLSVGGTYVELIYFLLGDLQEQVERAYGEGLDSEAFTTSLLYTLAHGRPLYDPTGALRVMRDRLNGEFPEATFRAVLERRSPLLRFTIKLLRRAQRRNDLLSVQQMRALFQSVFFNLLFTLNRRYHPGEKRLLIHSQPCPLRPPANEERWEAAARMAADDPAVPGLLDELAVDLLQQIDEHSGLRVRHEVW